MGSIGSSVCQYWTWSSDLFDEMKIDHQLVNKLRLVRFGRIFKADSGIPRCDLLADGWGSLNTDAAKPEPCYTRATSALHWLILCFFCYMLPFVAISLLINMKLNGGACTLTLVFYYLINCHCPILALNMALVQSALWIQRRALLNNKSNEWLWSVLVWI